MKMLFWAAIVAAYIVLLVAMAVTLAFPAHAAEKCVTLADVANNLMHHGATDIDEVTIRYSGRTMIVGNIGGEAFGALIANGCLVLDPHGMPVVVDLGKWQVNREQ